MRPVRLGTLLAAVSGVALLGSCGDDAEDAMGSDAGADSAADSDSDTDADSDADIPDPDPAAPFAAVELFTSES